MYARVSTLRMRPARVDQSLAFVEAEVVPTYRRMRGFRGALWLLDRPGGTMLAINLWATLADLQRADPRRFGWVERTMRYLTVPPELEVFETRVEDRLIGIWDVGVHHARVEQATFVAGQLEEGLLLLRERLVVPQRMQLHYLGRLLLANPERQLALSISFWETGAAADVALAAAPNPDDRFGNLLAAPIDVAGYDVVAHG